jgi:hypothetical protein
MLVQRYAPVTGRHLGLVPRAILALSLLGALQATPARAVDNFGLGPLSIRNQFPVTLSFLTYTPDTAMTLPSDGFRFRYQYALTNTFINTQSPLARNPPVIDAEVVRGGLTGQNFPPSGYGLYLDTEGTRHLFRLAYGLADSLEVELELAWVGFGGGFMDSNIEGVERLFGGLNQDRLYSHQDRYDFYVVRDRTLLQSGSEAFSRTAQDPVVNLKWNLGEGGDVLPAFTVKLSYKSPLQHDPAGKRRLVSSGGTDYGYYFFFSKAVGDVVGHFQLGTTRLEVAPDTFAERLRHRMFGLEFRLNLEHSLVLQSVTQTSIFIRSDDPRSQDFSLSRPTDVVILGWKHRSAGGFLFDLGLVEDYNQQRNESDITLFLELGWKL